jgi:hypothetical protein
MFEQIVIRSNVKKQELKESIGECLTGVPCWPSSTVQASLMSPACFAACAIAQLESSASSAAASCASLLVDDLNEEVKQVCSHSGRAHNKLSSSPADHNVAMLAVSHCSSYSVATNSAFS